MSALLLLIPIVAASIMGRWRWVTVMGHTIQGE
jgi:hypothetical protein